MIPNFADKNYRMEQQQVFFNEYNAHSTGNGMDRKWK